MSILDSFYIVFKALGEEDVKKSEEEVKKSGDKLNESLKNTSNLGNKASESFTRMGHEMLGFLSAAISVGSVLEGIKGSIDYAIDLDRSSQALQVNVGELDAWDSSVKRIGGTAEAFQGSLRNLSQRLGTTGEVALKLLPQLADAFHKMNRNAAIRYGENLGLDEKTILLLQKGRREVETVVAQQKELGVVSKKDAEEARNFSYAWQDATHAFRSAFMGVAEEILPFLTRIITLFGEGAEYFKKHSDLIIGALIAIGVASAIAFPELYLGIAIVGALSAAFALLYEDIKYFITGQDSLIGHILKRWPEVGAAVRATIRDFEKFAHFLDKLYEKYYKFISGGKSFRIYGEYGDHGADDKQTNTPENYWQRLVDMKNAFNLANSTPLNSQTSNSIFNGGGSSNKNVSVNTGPITINTQATDPQGVLQAFGQNLDEHLQQANAYFDDGVAI